MDGERRAARTLSVTGAERCKWRRVATLALTAGLGLAVSACAAESPEEAACTQWAMIQPCTAGGGGIDGCIDFLSDLRTDYDGEGECRTEYDALISCWRALTACPSGDFICPDEATALTSCGRRP